MHPLKMGADGKTNRTMDDLDGDSEIPVAVAVDDGEAVAAYASPAPSSSVPAGPVAPGALAAMESTKKIDLYSRIQVMVGVVSAFVWVIFFAGTYNYNFMHVFLGGVMIGAGIWGYWVSSETGQAMEPAKRAALLQKHRAVSGVAHFGTGILYSLDAVLAITLGGSETDISEPAPTGVIVAYFLLSPAYFLSGRYVLVTIRPLREFLATNVLSAPSPGVTVLQR